MRISYFDTSILLPILIYAHPNHHKCLALLEQARSEGEAVTTTTHAYAELYSNLTRLPLGLKIPPTEAAEAIIDKLGDIMTIIDLTRADYEAAIRRCAKHELVSGIIYDALHLQAAIKTKADVLYTANLRDFKRLHSTDFSFFLEGIN